MNSSIVGNTLITQPDGPKGVPIPEIAASLPLKKPEERKLLIVNP